MSGAPVTGTRKRKRLDARVWLWGVLGIVALVVIWELYLMRP